MQNEPFIRVIKRVDGKYVNEIWKKCDNCNEKDHKANYRYCFTCNKKKQEEYKSTKSNVSENNNNYNDYNFID